MPSKRPRFKHLGVMLTTPKGRIHLTVDTDKWNDEYQRIIDTQGHELLRAMFAVGTRRRKAREKKAKAAAARRAPYRLTPSRRARAGT